MVFSSPTLGATPLFVLQFEIFFSGALEVVFGVTKVIRNQGKTSFPFHFTREPDDLIQIVPKLRVHKWFVMGRDGLHVFHLNFVHDTPLF